MQPCPEEVILPAHRAVAQLAEHRSPKPTVGGSSPSRPARGPVAQRQLLLVVTQASNDFRGFESLPAHI